ncbi:MAG: WG repeat-containing protein [Paludibacteraceae bacterium]|nr:WG repeat-containing protein [Paludibacteraceae bacterium]
MKGRIISLALVGMVTFSSFALDSGDVIEQVVEGKFEKAIKSRAKLGSNISDSREKLLYDISECLLYNSPKYAGYNPMKAYSLYKNISYSDFLYDKKVMDVLRENEISIESIRESVEKNLMAYAKKKATVAAYDEIIGACQGCSYLSDAKALKEDLLFTQTMKNASIRDVEKFIADYPKSPKKAQAIAFRDSLAYVSLSATSDAYNNYILTYPESKWVPNLKSKLEKMAFEEAEKLNTINAYAKYIATYPENTSNVRKFEEKIAKLQKSVTWLVSPKYKNIVLVTDSTRKKSYYLVNDVEGWGILAENGTQIILPEYQDFGTEMSEGYIAGKKNGRWGVVEVETGKSIGEFQMSSAKDIRPLSRNFIAFKAGGSWGVMDHSAEVVINPFLAGNLTQFNFKMMANGGVAMNYNGNLIIIDGEGKQLVNQQYDEVTWRASGDIDSRFIKTRIGKKYGIINDLGVVMMDNVLDMLPYFDSDAVASVKNFTKEGWIDTTGNYLYFGSLSYFRDCGGTDKMMAYEVNGKIGFINKAGGENIPLQYDQLGDCFLNGLAKVKQGNKWLYINTSGNEIASIPASGNAKMVYSGNIIVIKNGSQISLVSPDGQTTQLRGYDDVDDEASCGLLRVRRGGKWGAVNYLGQEVVPASYDELTKYCNGYSIVKKNGKYGLLYNSSVVLDTEFDRLVDGGHFFDTNCNTYKDGKTSNVYYIQAFFGPENEKYVFLDGKVLLKTKDEVRLDKPANLYTIVKFADMGIFSNATVGLVDPKGKILVNPMYLNIVSIPGKDNYFIYTSRTTKKQGILNAKGEEMTPAIADKIISFDGSVVYVENNGDITCFDEKGNSLLPVGYDVNGKILKNKINGKYGVMDESGDIKLYPSYNKVVGATANTAVVDSEGKYGIVKY